MARRLGAGVYGVVAFASAVLLYFNFIADFGGDAAGVPRVARAPERVGVVAPSLLIARLGIGALLWLVLAIVGLTLLPQPEGAVLAAMALVLMMRGANARWVLIGLERSGPVGWSRTAAEVLTAVIVVIGVRGSGDLGLVPLAQFAGDAFGALALLVVLQRMGVALPVRVDRDEVRGALKDGWPLVLHATLAMLSFNADLIILRFFRDTATVGQYAVAYTLVSYLANLGGAFAVSVLPALSRERGEHPETASVYRGALLYAAALALPCAVGGWILAPGIIALVFGRGYEPAGQALTVLIWTIPAIWLRFVIQMALVGRGRQDLVLRATMFGAAAAVALDLLVIPRWGIMGAAVVSVSVEAMRLMIVLAFGARSGVPAPALWRGWRVLLAAGGMGLAVRALVGAHVLVAVVAGAATYALAVVLLGGVVWRRGELPLLRT